MTGINTRRLCAHAELDGKGMHFLEPGDKCSAFKTFSEPGPDRIPVRDRNTGEITHYAGLE